MSSYWKRVGGCLLCTTSSNIWNQTRSRFSYTHEQFALIIMGNTVSMFKHTFNKKNQDVPVSKRIKVKSWLGKTIFPSLLHYAQIEMRFLFNEIIHTIFEKKRWREWSCNNKKSMAFFQTVYLSKRAQSKCFGWIFIVVVAIASCLTAHQPTRIPIFR